MMKHIKRILLTGVTVSVLSVNTAVLAQGSSLGAAISLMTALSRGLPVCRLIPLFIQNRL